MQDYSLHYADFEDVPGFSKFDKAFQRQESTLTPFVGEWPTIDNILAKSEDLNFPQNRRDTLVEVVSRQYEQLGQLDNFTSQIQDLAQDNVYTILTAHQPVLFGGPLYIPYKIASTINLSDQLNQTQSGIQTVPVFVIGGEDHDFEEMNHLNLFGERITWSDEQGGPVGRYVIDSLEEVIKTVLEKLGQNSVYDIRKVLMSSFTSGRSYGQAYQDFLIKLFGSKGILIINMDDPILKDSFKHIIREELLESPSQALVEDEQNKLESGGYKKQAHAREINLFYLEENVRSVILREEDGYRLRELDRTLSQEELLDLLEKSPESFSPNVVLRPIYQEFCLPNLAYIGGGGELAYWSERRKQFAHFDLQRPALVRRNSVIWLESFVLKKMEKSGLEITDLFSPESEVIRVRIGDESDAMDKLNRQSTELLERFAQMGQMLDAQSPSLGQYAAAEHRKFEKTLASFEDKLVRQIKKDNEVLVNQVKKIFDTVYPEGKLQERHANFLPFLARYGEIYLDILIKELNPLDRRVVIIKS